jgi:hypothetical protein
MYYASLLDLLNKKFIDKVPCKDFYECDRICDEKNKSLDMRLKKWIITLDNSNLMKGLAAYDHK